MADRPISEVLSGTLFGAPSHPGVPVCTVAEGMQTGGDQHTDKATITATALCIDYHQQSLADLNWHNSHYAMYCHYNMLCSTERMLVFLESFEKVTGSLCSLHPE